jgi:uracil-DNA glycosylase
MFQLLPSLSRRVVASSSHHHHHHHNPHPALATRLAASSLSASSTSGSSSGNGWRLEASWNDVLKNELRQPYWHDLTEFVDSERALAPEVEVVPPAERTFAAFEACPFERVSVVILGQDPYPTPGHADGLAFSVPQSVSGPLPGSLRNVFEELQRDVGVPPALHGDLSSWAAQGVLLLNTALSTRAGEPGAHAGRGWERLTDVVIDALSTKKSGVVFMLWGSRAQRKAIRVDGSSHLVLRAAHPSPLSARRGFFGTSHFSAANRYLRAQGRAPIDWSSHVHAFGDGAKLVASSGTGSSRGTGGDDSTPGSTQAATEAVATPIELLPDEAFCAASETSSSNNSSLAVPGAAPQHWWKQLAAIERARSARSAPVDFIGCHMLGEKSDGEAAFRFQTLVALILSTRTSDNAVASAMQRLRTLAAPLDQRGRLSAQAVAELDTELLGKALVGVTYSKVKTERLARVATTLTERYAGDAPRELTDVLSLPGVGPKVAHLFMQVGWGETLGIGVDTHVHRIAGRLGWTRGAKNAEATREQLELWMPREHWQELNPLLVGFGQQVCADKPACRSCRLAAERLCPQIGVAVS